MRKGRLFASLLLSAGMLFALPSLALAEDITISAANTQTNFEVTDEGSSITVSGHVTLNGAGDAFTITGDTELVFEDNSSLTLSGYDNAFVVNGATLSGEGWKISDGSGMDLFRLQSGGKLDVTGSVDLDGADKSNTESRAIVLESGSGQGIDLASGATLAANNFYRGIETGGASGYTIKGAGMDSSTFDFSGNDCGMALSYFDSNAHFEGCKLEVSNCATSGIFMRQDNAALDGLYIDGVNINCVNDANLNQADIAIRFHSNNFTIQNSEINIQNAWNTGLWICDGWNANEQNEILNTQITVNNVYNKSGFELYDVAQRRKAITFVPYRDWLIDGCTITMNGTSANPMEGGLNIASDIKLNSSSMTAKASMFGGHVKLADTDIHTSFLSYADIGVQIGQFLEVGQNVTIDNDYDGGANPNWIEHFTILCDDVSNGYQVTIFGSVNLTIKYDATNMTPEQASPNRLKVTGGSYWSTRNQNLSNFNVNFYDCSVPVNNAGEDLEMFAVDPDAFTAYSNNGAITLIDKSGTKYAYQVTNASEDGYRYIWAPAVTVSFVDSSGNTVDECKVPRGTAFAMTGELPEGNWDFSTDQVITSDLTVHSAE